MLPLLPPTMSAISEATIVRPCVFSPLPDPSRSPRRQSGYRCRRHRRTACGLPFWKFRFGTVDGDVTNTREGCREVSGIGSTHQLEYSAKLVLLATKSPALTNCMIGSAVNECRDPSPATKPPLATCRRAQASTLKFNVSVPAIVKPLMVSMSALVLSPAPIVEGSALLPLPQKPWKAWSLVLVTV